MADEAEEAAERVAKCVKWSNGWAEANPDPVVADAVAEGLVTLGCLPSSRLKRMLERETLEPESLTEGQMHYLGQKGLLDPEEVETVDDDEEEEADDGDGGRTSLSDLDEEAQERLVAKMEEEIEERVAEARADDGADGDGVDETGQEGETADGGDEEAENADDGGDGDNSIRTASQAM